MKKENKKKYLTEERFKSLLMAIVLSISSFNIGCNLNKNNANLNNNKDKSIETIEEDSSVDYEHEYLDEYEEYNVDNLYLIDVSMCKNISLYKNNVFVIAYKKLDSEKHEMQKNDDYTYIYRDWETYYDILKEQDIYFINEFYSLKGNGEDLIPGNTTVDGRNGSMTFRNYDYNNIISLNEVIEALDDSTINSYISESGKIKKDDIEKINKLLDILSSDSNNINCSIKTRKLIKA